MPTIVLQVLLDLHPSLDLTAGEYSCGIVAREQIWTTYRIRYQIAVAKKSQNDRTLALWLGAVEQLQGFREAEVALHSFRHPAMHWTIIFSDVACNTILGYIPLTAP